MSTLLKFYDQQCQIKIPNKYNEFKTTLCSVLQFPNFNELIIYYIDSDGDKIIVGNEMDFEELKKQIARKEVEEIEVMVSEGSKLKIPIIAKEDQVKESKSSINQIEVKDQNKPEENEFEIKEQPKLQSQQLNQKTDQIKGEPMKKGNEIPSNPHNPSSFTTNNPMKQNEPNQILLNNMLQKEIVFDVECMMCHENPIKKVLYYCEQCSTYLCPNCETKHGPTHRHPLLKIRKPANIPISISQSKINNKPMNQDKKENDQISFIDSIKQIPNTIKNFFHDETKDPKYLLRVARANYDLKEITDDKILMALKKAKNNIDEAVILLAQEK